MMEGEKLVNARLMKSLMHGGFGSSCVDMKAAEMAERRVRQTVLKVMFAVAGQCQCPVGEEGDFQVEDILKCSLSTRLNSMPCNSPFLRG